MSNLEQTAAVITAAFVAGGGVQTIDGAAKRYFDCLEALNDERKNREATSDPKESGEPSGPRPEVVRGHESEPARL